MGLPFTCFFGVLISVRSVPFRRAERGAVQGEAIGVMAKPLEDGGEQAIGGEGLTHSG